MLELLYLFAFVAGVRRAARLRHRPALVLAALVAYLVAADLLGAIAGVPEQGGFFGLFSTVFVGPSASPLRATSVLPLPAPLIAQPLWVRALRCTLCWLVAWICLRESSRLNPLVPRAYALDGVAFAFTGAGVVDAVEAVILLWARLMLGDEAGLLG